MRPRWNEVRDVGACESDAATFVRNEALRRVTTAEELARVSRAMMLGEPVIDGEAIAGAILILVAALSWTIAVRRSLVTPPRRFGVLGRTLVPGIITLLLSTLCALFMNFVGESSHQNQDVPMTLAFMVLGMLAFFGGQRLTGSVDKQRLTKTYAHLPLIGAILVSLGAVLHLIVAN